MTANDQSDSALEARVSKSKDTISALVGPILLREERLSPLNEFEAIFTATESAIAFPDESSPIGEYSRQLWRLAREMFFMQRVVSTKEKHILRGAKAAVDAGNILVFVYCLRALVEHAGSMARLCEIAAQLKNGLRGINSSRQFEEALARGRKATDKCYYGSSRDGAETKPVHVHDLVRSLGKVVRNAEQMYGWLSEYVHPNHGSNVLITSGAIGSGRMDLPLSERVAELEQATTMLGEILVYLNDAGTKLAADLMYFDQTAKRANQPATTIANWLSQKSMKAEGNGRTKESAIHFPRARTKLEAMESIYEYIARLGAEVISQQMVAIDDEAIIDLMITTKGPLYFRTPKDLL